MTTEAILPEDLPISLAPIPPTRSVVVAAQYLVDRVAGDMGVKNGKTALYWHLIQVIGQHADTTKKGGA